MIPSVLTVEERAALLRAARVQMNNLNEDIIRLHAENGHDTANRRLAESASGELTHLAEAVRKLWLASLAD